MDGIEINDNVKPLETAFDKYDEWLDMNSFAMHDEQISGNEHEDTGVEI